MREYARVGTNAYICLYVHTCMYEYVYAYMNVRMMRAYMFECVFLYMHVCACVRACVCVYVYTSVRYFFLTSNLLHLESNIYVGLLAYMRTHTCQHLKSEVRQTNSHGRIHTHTY